MKLQIQLVPSGLWGINLRKKLSPTDWRVLSRYVRDSNHHTCEYCGIKQSSIMHCHEEFHYNINVVRSEGIQVLAKLVCVCCTCHAVIHWGRSEATLKRTELSELTSHAIRVNDTTPDAWDFHRAEAKLNWDKANMIVKQWITDYRGLDA